MSLCKKTTKVITLTDDQIAERLCTENKAVIESLYSLVIGLYNGEGERTKAIDAKAATLFGFVGAIISATFIVIGFLFDSKTAELSVVLSGWPHIALIIILICLTIALIFLFRSVIAKKSFRAPGDIDLFDAVIKYDEHVEGDSENANKSSHKYKRHLIEHFWKLYNAILNFNEKKASQLYYGQLFVFIGLIILLIVQIAAVAAFKGDQVSKDKNTQQPVATSNTSTSSNDTSASPNGRPAPLQTSSNGTQTRDNGRPNSLNISSNGKTIQNSEGKTVTQPASNDKNPSGKK